MFGVQGFLRSGTLRRSRDGRPREFDRLLHPLALVGPPAFEHARHPVGVGMAQKGLWLDLEERGESLLIMRLRKLTGEE